MRYQSASIGMILTAVLSMAASATGIRREFAAIDDHARRSLATALDERSLPVLVRRSVRTPDATIASLIDVVDESRSISLCRKDVAGIRKRSGSSYWKRLETYGFSRR